MIATTDVPCLDLAPSNFMIMTVNTDSYSINGLVNGIIFGLLSTSRYKRLKKEMVSRAQSRC